MRYYENLTLAKLPNERWVSCIGYEDYYMVSNKGRIKSLPRIINAGSGRTRITKPKILKQQLTYKDGRVIDCRIQLKDEGTPKMHQVGRLVYYSFHPKEIYFHSDFFIIKKNKRGWDCRLRNLIKGTRSASRRIDAKESEATKKQLKEIYNKSLQVRRKKMKQKYTEKPS